MKRICLALIFCFLLVIVSTVCAADWLKYGELDGNLYFYDVESVINPTDDSVRFWSKTILQKKVKGASYLLTLWEIKCSMRETRLINVVSWDNAGKVIDDDREPSAWVAILPNSLGAILYNEFCPIKREYTPGNPFVNIDPKTGNWLAPTLKQLRDSKKIEK